MMRFMTFCVSASRFIFRLEIKGREDREFNASLMLCLFRDEEA